MNSAIISCINNYEPKNYYSKHSLFHHTSKISVMNNKHRSKESPTLKMCRYYPNSELKKYLDNNNISYKKSWKREKLIKTIMSF